MKMASLLPCLKKNASPSSTSSHSPNKIVSTLSYAWQLGKHVKLYFYISQFSPTEQVASALCLVQEKKC
jgi:hypothetical protein